MLKFRIVIIYEYVGTNLFEFYKYCIVSNVCDIGAPVAESKPLLARRRHADFLNARADVSR